MVNVAASRLVLNLKTYAGRKREGSRDWHVSTPLPQIAPLSPPGLEFESSASNSSSRSEFDLEMYSIERDCQQIGTRLH